MFKANCKFYEGSKPCVFHKLDQRLCIDCKDFRKIEAKIVIIKLEALGDVLRTTSILPAIHLKYPNCSITWVTKRNASELLRNNPYIDNILFIESNYLEFVLNEKFNAGFCLDADKLSASILSLANCGVKYGFVTNEFGQVIPANKEASNWYNMGLDDNIKKNNKATFFEIMHQLCLLKNINSKPQFILTEKHKDFANSFFRKNKLDTYKKIIGINTGAGKRWECKKWVIEHYIALINLLHTKYSDFGILLYGGHEEIEFNKEIVSQVGNRVIDTGCNNSISEFASLISLSNIFLTSDSLGMHMSISLDITTLVLVGPTSPWELDVFGNGEIFYNNELSCLACYDSICKKNKECITTITPEMVLAKLIKHF